MPSRMSPRSRRRPSRSFRPRALAPADDNDAAAEELPVDDWALDAPARTFSQDVSWLDPDDEEAQPEPGFWIDPDQIRED